MKSVAIISTVTFLLIFGGVAALSLQLSGKDGGHGLDDPGSIAANQRLLRNLEVERDRVQREHEELAGFRSQQAAREVLMEQVHTQLLEVVGEIEKKQQDYVAEQAAAADRLAKMYEAMKPDKAARILASMDMEVTLAIISRMKERPAAKVLSYMDAGLAAQLSTRLSLQEGA